MIYVLEHKQTGKPACFIKDAFDDITVIDFNQMNPVFAHSNREEIESLLLNNHEYIWSSINGGEYFVKEVN